MESELVLTVEKLNSGWVLTVHKGTNWANDVPIEVPPFSDAYSGHQHEELVERIAGVLGTGVFPNYKLVEMGRFRALEALEKNTNAPTGQGGGE